MGIFRGIGGTGNSTDDGVVDAVTAQAVIATNKATEAANSATSAYNDAQSASTSKDTAITQANAAQSSANTASTQATNASTSATSAATSATSATASATTATTKASEAATSATNAATSETNAATSATTATTKASEAATSATTATTKAGEASTSATNAASSATSASTSASTATTKASEASTSAASAASSYDSFDDRYLGAKSSAPSVDNDGDALITGALYFDTTSDSMKVYSGSAWLDAYATLSGALIATNNLSDLNNVSTARTNLGLGTAATTASTDYATAAQGTTADNALPKSGGAMTGAITTNSTFDGRDVSADGAKLDGIEAGATADQTAGEIKTAYESNADTNAFTDADHSKLDGIEASADVTDTANVTAAGALMDSELTSEASVKALNQGVATTDSPSFAGLTVDTSTFSIDSANNRVGIGTASPAQELHLKGSGEMARLESTSATGNTWMTFHSPSARIGYFGYGSASDTHLRIVNDTSGDILASTNGSERIRIDSSGNVGIADSTPSAKLDVNGAVLLQGGTFTAGIDSGTAGIVLDIDKPIFTRDSSGNYLRNLIKHESGGAIEIGQSGTALISAINLTAGSSGAITAKSQLIADKDTTTSTANATIISKGSVTTTTGYNPQNYHITFQDGGGNTRGSISSSHFATIYSTSSDYRLKEDIQPITNATATVLSLKPCNFRWINGQLRNNGFIAHELQEIVPEAVTGTKDGTYTEEYVIEPAVEGVSEAVMGTRELPEYQGIDQSKLVPLLVKTIQELEARITALEAD